MLIPGAVCPHGADEWNGNSHSHHHQWIQAPYLFSLRKMHLDENRMSLNLGERNRFYCWKEEDIKREKVYTELTGYCNANDAYHPSSLSDEMLLPVECRLCRCGLTPCLACPCPRPDQFYRAHGPEPGTMSGA